MESSGLGAAIYGGRGDAPAAAVAVGGAERATGGWCGWCLAVVGAGEGPPDAAARAAAARVRGLSPLGRAARRLAAVGGAAARVAALEPLDVDEFDARELRAALAAVRGRADADGAGPDVGAELDRLGAELAAEYDALADSLSDAAFETYWAARRP